MRLYAELAPRRTRQILLDAAVAASIVVWVAAANAVHDAVLRLAAPGRALQSAGNRLSGSLDDAAGRADDLPLIGDRLRGPLESAGRAARGVAAAGLDQQLSVQRLALLLAVLVALAPITAVLVMWLPNRIRWIRAAAAPEASSGTPAAVQLLALRALVHRPLDELSAVDPQPAAAYARSDPDVLHALAALELRALGLQPPPKP